MAEVIRAAALTFTTYGYEGASVDRLVTATGVHRGSLYGAFGSKRGLFLAALDGEPLDSRLGIDLLLVALLDLAPHDAAVRERCQAAIARMDGAAGALGDRLLDRAGLHILERRGQHTTGGSR